MTFVEFANTKWFNRLVGPAIGIIGILIAQWLISGREANANLRNEFEKRPTIEQVEIRFSGMKDYVDKGDENNEKKLDQFREETNKTNSIFLEYLKSIASDVREIKKR